MKNKDYFDAGVLVNAVQVLIKVPDVASNEALLLYRHVVYMIDFAASQHYVVRPVLFAGNMLAGLWRKDLRGCRLS